MMMTTDETIPSPSVSPAAARMRLHRRRRRRGLSCVTLQLHVAEIDALVGKGILPQERRHDPISLQIAVHELISRALEDVA